MRDARVVVSAATENADAACAVPSRRCAADGTASAAGGRPAKRRPHEAEIDFRRPGLGRLQAAAGARLCRRARCARRSSRERRGAADGDRTIGSGQVGRSVPRLEGQAKVTGRAEYVHNLRLPGMLYGKIFRSTVAHGRIKSARRQRGARAAEGVHRVVTIDDVRKVDAQSVSTARPSTTSRSSPPARCTTSASRSRWCWPPIRMSPRQAAQLIEAEYEELPAVFDEVEAMTSKAIVHDVLKPAGTFPDLKHLQGQDATPTSRSTFICGAATSRRRVRGGRPRVRAHASAPSRCCTCRSSRSCRSAEPTDDRPHHPHRLAVAVVRAHRDRAAARLAGEQGAREGAVSRRRLRRQALHQARSAGGGAGAARAAAGEDRAHDGGAVLHAHQARQHVPHQERASRTAASPRANARCGGTAAPMPISARASRRSPASPRPGPTTSTTSQIDSYSLYTNLPPAGALRGFGIPQLVWAYESHTDMMARALEARSDRVPPQEHPARRPPAGDRHR